VPEEGLSLPLAWLAMIFAPEPISKESRADVGLSRCTSQLAGIEFSEL